MKDNRLRALAVTSPERAALAPDVPSVKELGMTKLIAENFLGISAPAGVPAPIAARMHAAMVEVMKNDTVQKRLADLAVQSRPMSIAEFNDFVAAQVKEWEPAVKASGAKLN
jgi:tripartite-type tricarboxylate transporter receptor subunit TctC